MTDPSANQILTEQERDEIANALEGIPYFSHLGKRLLKDLVDRSDGYGIGSHVYTQSVIELPPEKGFGKPAEVASPILGVSVVRGIVRASAQGDPVRPLIDLTMGSYGRHDAGMQSVEIGDLKLDAHPERTDEVLYTVHDRDLLELSPILASRIIAYANRHLRENLKGLEQRELIWFEGDHAHANLSRPMAHLLATVSARSGRHTAILDFAFKEMPLRMWDGHKFCGKTFDPSKKPREVLPKDQPGSVYVVVSPDARFPDKFPKTDYDRIVYLADEIPKRVPKELGRHLHADLFDKKVDKHSCEPYFVSFVTTYTVGSKRRAHRRPGRFRTLPIAHARIEEDEDKTPHGLRLYRDACPVPVHHAAMRRAWAKWLPEANAPTATFLDFAVAERAIQAVDAERWWRAVAIKRTGVALSGGGASAYRFAPVLARMARRKIPVDVFTGLSGGALLGAYYCTEELAGVQKYIRLGPLSQLLLPFAFALPDLNERILNLVLAGARVEDLSIRLCMVAVELPDDGPPSGVVVREGTVAEAARASSTLPPVFSPTEINGIRYADGGACTFVPARIARDCGADSIFACNAIPGPEECNPFPASLYGTILRRYLRRLPLLDRVIDYRSWFWFQFQQASRVFGLEADVLLEFRPSAISLAEPTLFVFARQIAAEAAKHPHLGDAVNDFEKLWKKLVWKA